MSKESTSLETWLRLDPPPSYTRARQVKNPFKVGQTVTKIHNGIYIGEVVAVSPMTYDHYHYARVSNGITIFDYLLDLRYTLGTGKESNVPCPWYVGQRIFWNSRAVSNFYTGLAPSYAGAVIEVSKGILHPDVWVATTNKHAQSYTSKELARGWCTIGQRRQPQLQ